jgi:hypothetical protein
VNIYQEEIEVLKTNKQKFEELLKRENFKGGDVIAKNVLVLFDKFEKELENNNSKKRDGLILEGLPLFYYKIFTVR